MTTGTDAAALRERLIAALDPPVREALDAVAAAAPGALYAVGGAVRDALLRRAVHDIDLVIDDSDAAAVLRTALPGARIVAHARFGTASAQVDGTRIDLARARSETYARPGALPRVAPADIDADLRRRDFAANALALRLDGTPRLLDPCGGAADIAARRLRVLHDRSFADDPTRIFRAFRYAARLGFDIDAHTAALLREAVPLLGRVSGARLRREVELTLREATGGVALEACAAARVLRAVHPALRWDARRTAALETPTSAAPRVLLGWALLAADAGAADGDAIVARLSLTRAEAAAVRAMPSLAGATAALRRAHVRPSGVAVLLDRYPGASVAAFAGTTGDAIARRLALRYLGEWRQVKPLLSGRDLQDLGVPAGPQVRRGLQLLRAARLDGWAGGRAEERTLAARFARSIADAGRPEVDRGD